MRKLCVIAALGAVFLWVSPAGATTRAWVSECGNLGATQGGDRAQICAIPFLAHSGALDISTVKAVTVSAQTRIVRICTEVQVSIDGVASVATDKAVMLANTCEYFGVQPSATLSILASP